MIRESLDCNHMLHRPCMATDMHLRPVPKAEIRSLESEDLANTIDSVVDKSKSK